jgi:hypothetical protein
VYGTRKLEREATRRMIFFSRSSTMSIPGLALIGIKDIDEYRENA